jgi:hypothetical protein
MSNLMIWRGLQVEPLAQRLQRYNEWRRGSETIEQPHPKQIGEDIDEAVELLLAMSSAIEATLDKNMHLADGDNCSLIDIARVARGDK